MVFIGDDEKRGGYGRNREDSGCVLQGYPEGYVANVQKGEVPDRHESLARYVVSPPISLRRIDEYDERRVTYHYRSHEMQRVRKERVSVYRFIGRMIQHVLPKGFKRIMILRSAGGEDV